MEVLALDVPINVHGAREAVQMLGTVERAGVRSAAGMTASMNKASAEIIESIMKTGSAAARAAVTQALESQKSSAAIVAVSDQRTAKIIRNEANLANHFRQMREREISAAERAAHAINNAMDRQNKAAMVTSTITAAGYQKWGNAAIRGAGAIGMIADAAMNSDKSMQNLLRTGSSIAFMFGPTGAIVGSVGIATSLIVSLFTKARDEMKKTETAFQDALVKIRRSWDEAGARSLFDSADLAWQQAIAAQERVQAELNTAREAAAKEGSKAAMGRVNQLEAELVTARRLTAEEERRYGQALEALDNIARIRREIDAPAGVVSAAQIQPRAMAGAPQPRGINPLGLQGIGGIPATAIGGAAAQVRANAETAARDLEEAMKNPLIQAIANTEAAVSQAVDRFSGSIGGALANGFAAAFSGEGIGGLIKGFGGTLLGSLGQMFVELGTHFIKFGSIMEFLKKKMTSIFGAGPGAVAAGVALVALGSAMGAGAGKIMSGGSASGGGYSSPVGQSIADQSSLYRFNPTTMDMSKVNPLAPIQIISIGTKDVQAQNDLAAMVRSAQSRGA